MEQSKKAFHIRLPEASYSNSVSFVKWINVHITPGIPVNKTVFDPKPAEEIFLNFKTKLANMTNLDLINASLKVKGEKLLTQKEIDFWFENQSIEISVEEITPGRFNFQTMMVGPAVSTVDNQISIGYENMTRFQAAVYFQNNQYFLIFANSEAGKTSTVPQDATPIKVFPLADFSYEMPTDKTEPKKTIQSLLFDYNDYFHNFLINYLPELMGAPKAYMFFDGLIIFKESLRQQCIDSSEIMGGLFDPWTFSAYTIEVPVENGYRLLTMASVSFGRRMNFMLPTLIVKNESDESVEKIVISI